MSITKYLARYAEPEADINTSQWPSFDYALVIPAFDEPISAIHTLESFLKHQQNCLIILVLNQPKGPKYSLKNQEAFEYLSLKNNILRSLFNVENNFIYVVDRFSKNPISANEGVGMARKIGADVATALYAQNKLKHPWIYCTDADVNLPTNYFSATQSVQAAACIYPHKHEAEASLSEAMSLYQKRLDWYVNGLQSAGSKYAYHTVGSTLAIHINAYCQVRGFPKLAAGEDFHILNKLAKVGDIKSLREPTLVIQGRKSTRVPFGTGPSLIKLSESDNLAEELMFEPPIVFETLRLLLTALRQCWQFEDADNAGRYLDKTVGCPDALDHINIDKMLRHAFKQSSTQQQFNKHLDSAFDALQTRRFLAYLVKHLHPNISLTALIEADF